MVLKVEAVVLRILFELRGTSVDAHMTNGPRIRLLFLTRRHLQCSKIAQVRERKREKERERERVSCTSSAPFQESIKTRIKLSSYQLSLVLCYAVPPIYLYVTFLDETKSHNTYIHFAAGAAPVDPLTTEVFVVGVSEVFVVALVFRRSVVVVGLSDDGFRTLTIGTRSSLFTDSRSGGKGPEEVAKAVEEVLLLLLLPLFGSG